jgi:curved DNA-binding protein CbpA
MTRLTTNPYATLGVRRDATAQQVRRAYRRLAKRYHPDLHPDAETTTRMGRINQAWEILSNPTRRARYDVDNPPHGPAGSGHWSSSPRRPSPAATAQGTRSPGWASAGGTGGYPGAGTWAQRPSPSYAQRSAPPWPDQASDEGRRWPSVLATICLVSLVLVAAIVGLLPGPLFAIVLLFVASRLFRRVE